MIKILVLNGPNINMLGTREPEIYGDYSYDDLKDMVALHADELGIVVDVIQSNIEGELVTLIQNAQGNYEGIVLNPAAYGHYSIALLDAIKSISIPVIEVHISNIHKREEFRHSTVTASACKGQICGFGLKGYIMGIDALIV